MTILELMVLAVGVSMDGFSVSVCKGLSLRKFKASQALSVGFLFGVFHFAMLIVGFFLGKTLAQYITAWDHWIAVVLLAYLGINMIRGAKKEEQFESTDKLGKKELLAMAFATSVDVLALGITFAFLQVSILPAVTVIGIVVFSLSATGVFLGHLFGAKFRAPAQIAGGAILVLIGQKILLGHLGIFG